MPEIIQLNESQGWTSLGSSGMRLRAAGLKGNLIWRPPAEHAPFMASAIPPGLAAAAPDPVEQALQEAGLEDKGSFNATAGAMSIAGPPNQLVIEHPIAPDQIEFIIYRDESGIISLHLPQPAPPTAALLAAPAGTKPAQQFRYVIPMRHAPTPLGGVPRMAMLGSIPGKIIRFVGRAVTGFVGDVVYAAAKPWEDHYRPEGFLWGGTPDQLLAATPVAPTGANWQTIQGNKSLLFIHGTISSTVGAYVALRNFSAAAGHTEASLLYANYGNRVIGFNHHTLTKSVPQNAVDFLSQLPPGNYQFDVISHSRGGLLARALKELTPAQLGQLVEPAWTPPPGVNVQIGKIVLVGTPNVGTPLADPSDLPKAISRLASIATSFSQDVAAVGLGALFAIFGGIVEGGLGALPGLEDMNPGNPFLTQLNSASSNNAPYYGIQADFQPTGGLATAIENNGVDALFGEVANDLVVPTLGVSNVNGQVLPGTQVDAYPQSANVYHLDYFDQQGTWDAILGFLT
jgi:pimeloyl-ACP methyl ester carboxylesterase